MIRLEHRKERLQRKEKLRQTRIWDLEEVNKALRKQVEDLKKIIEFKEKRIQELEKGF